MRTPTTSRPLTPTARATTQSQDPVRLAVLASSPAHYHAPLYRRLAVDPRLDFTVLFASSVGAEPAEIGYGRPVVLERRVLDGYHSEFLRRASNKQDLWRPWALHDPSVVPALVKGVVRDPLATWVQLRGPRARGGDHEIEGQADHVPRGANPDVSAKLA